MGLKKAQQEARAVDLDLLAARMKADFAGQLVDVQQLSRRYEEPVSSIAAALKRLWPRPFKIVHARGVERAAEKEGTAAWHIMEAARRAEEGKTFPAVVERSQYHITQVRETAFRMRDAGLIRLSKNGAMYRIELPEASHDPR